MTISFGSNIESTDDKLTAHRGHSQVVNLPFVSRNARLDMIGAVIRPQISETRGLVLSFSLLARSQTDTTEITLITAASTYLEMQTEIDQLSDRVATLEEQIETLEAASFEGAIVLRTITREDAESEIIALFAAGETMYYSEISERLGIDLPMVVEICQELQKRGEIGIDDYAV